MSFLRTVVLAGFTFTAALGVANAQEVTPSHEKAARAAIEATNATNSFDILLPQAALELKNRLSANNPDRAQEIDLIVDEEALKLAQRRGVLESEAVKLFAANFSEAELNQIAEFFSTEAGTKYLNTTPVLVRELSQAARVWGQGIQRDLAEASSKRVEELLKQ